MLKWIAIFMMSIFTLQASSIRLQNTAPCSLKAIIYGADGRLLSEISVQAQGSLTWNDSSNFIQKENIPSQGPSKSRTPYIVHWVCPDGEIFSVSENVSTGALIVAGQGSGKKNCNAPKNKEKS